jgi:signal transduction histidine kinase
VADAFTLDDQTFVEGLALQATIAAHGVELTQSLATRVRHLISLDYIAVRIQDGHDINSALRAIMTGITSAEGLAFSRCMFFSSEQNGRFLKGELAIGPQSDSEANEIWEALNRDRGKWGLAGRDVLDVLLERAANFGAAVSAGSEADSPLCRKVREVSVRNEGDRAGAIKTCLQERRAVLVPSGVNDPARFIIDATTNPTEPMCAFACVPLLGKDSEILGVLVADNRFLSREHIIEEYELIGLGAFARLMSMTIENWNLQRSLKNSNFVEFTTKMGHVVGSYIRQLVEEIKPLEHLVRTQNNDHPEWLRHIVGLTRNVEQIKSFLQDCKRVGPPKQGEYQTLDLVKILSETIDSIHLPFEIKLERAGIQHPVFVRGVGRELSYAFTELLTNAALALGDQTAPEIKILVEVEPRAGGVGMSVRVEIEDNGVGIRAVPISRVFDLFFTEGTQGSGLGLAIVKQTITEHHGGTIAVVQGQPLGSRFIIRLPALAHESLGGL